MDPMAVRQDIEAIPVSRTWRVSGELFISHSSVIHHLYVLGKSIRSFPINIYTNKKNNGKTNILGFYYSYFCIR